MGVLLLSLIAWVPMLGIVLAPFVAGGAIGDRVERWPGWVAASAAVVWSLWWSDDVWIFLGLRPEALSASPSR